MEHFLSSGLKDADAAILAVPGKFGGVLIITDGTNPATVVVHDHASAASGTELFSGVVAGASNFGSFFPSKSINARLGIFVNVTGTGAKYIVYYR